MVMLLLCIFGSFVVVAVVLFLIIGRSLSVELLTISSLD